ncbi:GGDEF domain-containing protein [Enterobacter cloacae]|uniref:diguanylate cyclase n=1 Tax=Enterobacter cloacae TaxID=550 RepID=A0A3R8YVH6_ENTCL|nr:GGDEF domain-containing protein [Enterobacter cloacae]RSB24206.1 GGDEF domain-containing protein [Enterobacter cloacae]
MKTLSPSDNAQLFRETTMQFWNQIKPIVQLGLCIHFAFIFMFSMINLPLLSVFNIFSVLIYATSLKAIRVARYSLIGKLISIEIVLHALLATWVLGWDSNFHFYLYCLIPIIAFSFQNVFLPRLLIYLAILGVSVGGFAFRKHIGINSGITTQWLEIFGIVNQLTALGVLLYCTALSVHFTRSMQAKLFQTANRDSLTNLYTRRRIMHEVPQLTNSLPSSIILLDIDHFKQINDRLGHEQGDLILQRVAKAISSNVRTTDLASRWGGEEFLVLMPSTPANEAKAVADRILLRIREWAGELDDFPLTVTATLAVSEIIYGDSFENALIRADQALYQGKYQGRNQVIFASLVQTS